MHPIKLMRAVCFGQGIEHTVLGLGICRKESDSARTLFNGK